jgi:hypothetical protein
MIRTSTGCRRDERGSLPMAMLLTLVAISLSALLVPVVVNQLAATRTSSDRALALEAARAGLSSAMGQLRAATDSAGAGDTDRLPAGPLTGSVGPGGGQRYQVTISYRDLDDAPLTMPSTVQPVSAVVVSTGIAAATGTGTFTVGTPDTRTLQATYSFRLSNEIFPGGQIHVVGSSADLCLDAGSKRPAAGTPVVVQSCTGGLAQQLWAYKNDLSIVLASSKTATDLLGMCLDAGSSHVSGAQVKVQRCSSTSPPPAAQRWSLNEVANFIGTSNGSVDNFCFTVQSASASPVLLSDRTCSVFQLDVAAGAGAAGPVSKQLVNYQQFGRCLDVTNSVTASTYLIARPCVQAPDPTTIGWNQKWTLPGIGSTSYTGTGRIYTTLNGTDYCLRSPGTTVGANPTVVACSGSSVPAALTWRIYGATGSYATSYQIVDNTGGCLQPADPNASPGEVYTSSGYTGPTISRIITRICDGSAWQKWNAPAYLSKPLPLSQITER